MLSKNRVFRHSTVWDRLKCGNYHKSLRNTKISNIKPL
ncbi:hypothetical protein LEP1GSC150_3672 [Leptospira interrogans serovar Copenhageni str. LT2050]|uniref:Uncharacterized protein n=1 Tax=Leptospira interrogans serovar Copenhageni str. LT2050 TaxID=1001598 RepID=M3GB69_LEPIT|nr:hypothetical protein LEP1GSC150_3672 [Leptospira interrogans serovar Copenhageni str. LT2050]